MLRTSFICFMMNNEVISLEEKIMLLINGKMDQNSYDECQSTQLSKELKLSRNQVIRLLNELFNEKKLIKIKASPILYLSRASLESKYKKKLSSDEYKSLDELEAELNNQTELKNFEKLIGSNESMYQIVEKIKATVAYPPVGLPMLLYGPTGTGKSFMAKLTYEYCVDTGLIDASKNFVQVNCSEYANNPELLTANLFGYKKGAFTGADSDNLGLLHFADGGVLFLDEVHCLNAECQEKLFLYMDQGIYHLVGDNNKWYKSKCRIIFATTEVPQKALLKTFLRRIPVILTIPSLAQRGENEKLELMYNFLKNEEKRINKTILISSNVYELLLNHTFVGNIGELTNTIQASCVSALYKSNSDTLEIHAYDLPDSIRNSIDVSSMIMKKHKLVSLNTLLPVSDQGIIKDFYQSLINIKRDTSFAINAQNTVDRYFEKLIFNDNRAGSIDYLTNYLEKIFNNITEHYGFRTSHNELIALATYISEFSKNTYLTNNWINENYDEVKNLKKYLKLEFHREYEIGQDVSHYLKNNMNQDIDDFVECIICICMIKYFVHSGEDLTIAIIIAHGYSTASSIAEASNRMLNSYIFDAIDMPLDTSTQLIINKLNVFIESYGGNIKNLILLVDMGSLEEIYNGLNNVSKSNIAIANNVNTRFALFVGKGILDKKSLQEIFDESIEYSQTNYKIINSQKKEKVIVCSCATGLGTAEKLKEIIEDSLPEHLPVKVITYDYTSLLEVNLEEKLLKDYDVICVIGTLNPKLKNLHFIAIEELIMNSSLDFLTSYFADVISQEDMDSFQKKMLKNFSLTNIINNLTVLNPTQLLERVADAIDLLQQEMKTTFTNNTCFGLYVHICCLMERLVTREGIESYQKELSDCNEDFIKFYMTVKKAFKQVEKYYRVEIPIEEVEFINIYIQNMMVRSFDEYEGMEE